MLLAAAVFLLGLLEFLRSQGPVGTVTVAIIGAVVMVLALVSVAPVRWPQR